jgi:hypothetical protein
MIKRIAMTALSCLFVQNAAAQTVQIRSGDHDSFTRLVMTLPSRPQWRIESAARRASLIFAQPGLVFDAGRVFERITRDRLAAISLPAGQARLELELGCDCGLSAFWDGPEILVIDIVDPPEVPRIGTRRPQSRPPSKSALGLYPVEIAPQRPRAARFLTQQLDRVLLPLPEPGGIQPGPNAPTREIPPAAIDLAPMRSVLIREIGQAASQGLLTPDRRALTRPGRAEPATPSPSAPSTSDSQILAIERPARPGQSRELDIRLHSGIEAEMPLQIGSGPASAHIPACLPGEWTDLAAWGRDDAPFEAQVGPLLRDLLGEFDLVQPERAMQLVRLYLYFGLGIEARQALSLLEARSAETQALTELAVILEENGAPDGSLLRGQVDCATPAALWALLTYDRLPEHITFDHRLIQRSFAALPDHLRKHLGPALARKLTAAGHRQTADGILRAIDRRDPAPPPERALATAELARDNGRPDAAAAGFDAAIDSNTTASAEALIAVIRQHLAQGQPIPFDRVQLAGAYAQEHRGTSLGHRMARAYVAALAASGAFAQAFSEFDRLKPELPTEDQAELRNQLAASLTGNASDLDFLRYTLSDRLGGPHAFTPDTALAVSRRLLDTGFAEAAATHLAPFKAEADERAWRLLQADISLARNLPREALAVLMNIEGKDADARRGKARSLSGQFDSAVTHFVTANAPEALLEAAWMAADWARLQGSDDPVLREVADLMLTPDTPSADPDNGMLATTRRLLDQSTRSRETFGRLLDAKPMPQTPGD